MGAAADRLTGLAAAPDRFDIPFDDLRQAQIDAANERFQERRSTGMLLGHRATAAGITLLRDRSEMLPLLFPHTVYKSYAESWLGEKRWDRLNAWLDALSSHPVSGADASDVPDIDEWILRLGAAGHNVSCTSGTDGKSALLSASAADMTWSKHDTVAAFAWGSGTVPQRDRVMFPLSPLARIPRNFAVRGALTEAYADPRVESFAYPVPPISIGDITGMVMLRKRIAGGNASTDEITVYETMVKARLDGASKAIGVAAAALIRMRGHKLFLSGMWATLFRVAETVRRMGYKAQHFHPENTVYIARGPKGVVLPPDHRSYVFETFNITPDHAFQIYGMQEINSALPRCGAGRYHAPPWLVCLLLDPSADNLLPVQSGEMEGRAAFLDLSLDGRWGGVISGDRIAVDYGPCACGNQGPSIRDDITRYADLPGGDRINGADAIDIYLSREA